MFVEMSSVGGMSNIDGDQLYWQEWIVLTGMNNIGRDE